jgi:multiple sugar transport system permease protein
LLGRPNIGRFFLNSAILTVGTVALCLIVSAPAAYAAARFKFRGKNTLLLTILATSMIPGISILIPIYLLAITIDVLNSYLFMILVYSAWMIPQTIWFMKGFVEVVPQELEESALIDGCSWFGAFVRIVVPLIQPGLIAISILIFMFVWNDFLIGVILTTDDERRTVQVGLVRFIQDPIGVSWGEFMAFAMLAIAPVLVAFLLLQQRFVEGLTSGSVKG